MCGLRRLLLCSGGVYIETPPLTHCHTGSCFTVEYHDLLSCFEFDAAVGN